METVENDCLESYSLDHKFKSTFLTPISRIGD